MRLVEAEAEGPRHDDDEVVARPTPPLPEHRRVSVSLLFTIAVLSGTVTTIYTVFPERHDHLVDVAIAMHRDEAPTWQLERPTGGEVAAWAIAFFDDRSPGAIPEGAERVRSLDILNRRAALLRYRVEGRSVSLVVQRTRDMTKRRVSRKQAGLRAESWSRGGWSYVAVGPEDRPEGWMKTMMVP